MKNERSIQIVKKNLRFLRQISCFSLLTKYPPVKIRWLREKVTLASLSLSADQMREQNREKRA